VRGADGVADDAFFKPLRRCFATLRTCAGVLRLSDVVASSSPSAFVVVTPSSLRCEIEVGTVLDVGGLVARVLAAVGVVVVLLAFVCCGPLDACEEDFDLSFLCDEKKPALGMAAVGGRCSLGGGS